MTPTDAPLPERDGDDMLAAEYVLGVLSAEQRQFAVLRIEREPAFALLVDQWEARLAPLGEAFTPVAPPPELKRALDRRLHGADRTAPGGRLLQSLAFWRGLAGAALAALVVAAVLLFVAGPWRQPARELVASLAGSSTDVHYVAVYDPASAELGLSHLAGEHGAGRDFELWVIQGKNPPASLGIIPVGQSAHLKVPPQLRPKVEAGAVFAISLEPQGGSPTGLPTGPVVASGPLQTL